MTIPNSYTSCLSRISPYIKIMEDEEDEPTSELFRGLGRDEESGGKMILLHKVSAFLTFRDISRFHLASTSLNTIFSQHLFKPYGGCKMDGNILRFDVHREHFNPRRFVAGGVVGRHVLCDGRSQLRVTIPSDAGPCMVKIGITRERPNLTDFIVTDVDEEGEEHVIPEDGLALNGETFKQRQQSIQQRHHKTVARYLMKFVFQ